jgi:hypothetical protein
LVELVVAAAFIGVVSVSGIQALRTILLGRAKSVVVTSADELLSLRLNAFRTRRFSLVPISRTTATVAGTSPAVDFDAANFPPETIHRNGVDYTLYTYTQAVSHRNTGSSPTFLPPDTPNPPGIQVNIAVVWADPSGARRQIQGSCNLKSSNLPKVVGTVRNAGGFPIPYARVTKLDGMTNNTVTADSRGNFVIYSAGTSFALTAEAVGYRANSEHITIAPGDMSVSQDITLAPLQPGTGGIQGRVWVATEPVITMVAGDVPHPVTGFRQEYVECYFPHAMSTTKMIYPANLGLRFQRRPSQDPVPLAINHVANASTVFAPSWFLFANTSPVVVNGVTRAADFVWSDDAGNLANFPYFAAQRNIIPVATDGPGEGAGGLELVDPVSGHVYDRVGWKGPVAEDPGLYEGTPYDDGGTGLETNETYRRFSTPAGLSATVPGNYDTDDNADNWAASALQTPRTTAQTGVYAISGRPAPGAYLWADDAFSAVVPAAATTCSGRPCSTFSIINTSTGDVTLSGISGGVTQAENYGANLAIPNLLAGETRTVDFVLCDYGYKEPVYVGVLRDDNGVPVVGGMVGGKLTDALGAFVAPGGAASYQDRMQSFTATYVAGGYVTGVDFQFSAAPARVIVQQMLADGATPTNTFGYRVTRDGVAFPRYYGYSSSVSTLMLPDRTELLLATGTYLLTPVNPALAGNSSPIYQSYVNETNGRSFIHDPIPSFTLTSADSGTTIFLGTFTVRSRDGTFQGCVTAGGVPIRDGAVISAQTAVLAVGATPTTTSFTTLTDARGCYALSATPRTYNLYAWRRTDAGVVERRDQLSVALATQAVVTVNFSW